MALTQMQEMSIHDDYGRVKCPYCRKYRKRSDFSDQPACEMLKTEYSEVRIHVPPACDYCLEEGE